jgi:hypothetical protein
MSYLIALGEARSCLAALAALAALADPADDIDLSALFDRLLIELHFITGDAGPAFSPMVETRAELLGRLVDAVDRLVAYGVDGLSLELLLLKVCDPLLMGRVRDSRWATPTSVGGTGQD